MPKTGVETGALHETPNQCHDSANGKKREYEDGTKEDPNVVFAYTGTNNVHHSAYPVEPTFPKTRRPSPADGHRAAG